MNILITGAAGQIGYSLLHRLIDAGHLCMMTDEKELNLSDFFNKSENYRYNKWFNNHLAIDLSFSEASEILWQQFGHGKIEVIIHLAAITSLPECEANPAKAFNTSVGGTANILDFARKAGVPHVIFASTSAVYENNKEDYFTEDLAVNPKLVYSQSKKMAEGMIKLGGGGQ
jgi:nucleoside-diphosphate-sugar epimerase